MSKHEKHHQTRTNIFASRARHAVPTSSQSRFASKRSIANLSISKRSVALSDAKLDTKTTVANRLGITVYDENGVDVTPRPLHNIDFGSQKGHFFSNEGHSSTGTPTDAMSFASFYPTSTVTATASAYAQPFTKSIYGSTSGRSARSKKSSIESSEEIAESGPAEITTGFGDVTMMRREEVEVPTEEDLNKIVDIILEETDTIWLFDQKGVSVSIESEEAEDVKKKNAIYEELCKSKEGNDKFAERGMQTFNYAQKNKEIQLDKVNFVDVGVMVTTWDMFDTYATDTNIDQEISDESTVGLNEPTKLDQSIANIESNYASTITASESRASILASSAMVEADQDYKTIPVIENALPMEFEKGENPFWEKISISDSIKHHLVVMERVVTENIYQPKQAAYRGFEILIDPDKMKKETEATKGVPSPAIMSSVGPTLDRLWSYNCSITNGCNVSSMAWNKVNLDIIAVGYGHFGFAEQNKSKGGLACCWNLKNPEYPERVYHCKSSVTALDFSTTNPNLLAVGLYDGTVYIYNVRSVADQPVVDSFDCVGKHSGPIWQLCWVERDKGVGDERNEILVSISADGRIVQWSIRKGFECTDLMKLKRTGTKNPQKKKEKTEAFISRQAPGLSFDFHPKDTNMYLAGTEEGLIHKCSCSYNEQFLETYTGHTGPIYKIKWSPFASDVFLSCSADWSIRLWTQSELKPILNFFSTTKVVNDICWSPYADSVFCAVNEGAVEIWDLNVNTLDPLILHVASPGIKFSSCLFSNNSNSVLIGDSDGQVSVYQLKNISLVTEKKSNSLMSLVETTLANTKTNKHDD